MHVSSRGIGKYRFALLTALLALAGCGLDLPKLPKLHRVAAHEAAIQDSAATETVVAQAMDAATQAILDRLQQSAGVRDAAGTRTHDIDLQLLVQMDQVVRAADLRDPA